MKKKYEILYDWAITRLTTLDESVETETYADSLGEGSDRQNELQALIDSLRAHKNNLVKARANKQLYIQWEDIRNLIDKIEQHFPAFPNLEANRLKLTLLIAQTLVLAIPPPAAPAVPGQVTDFDEIEIDESLFEIRSPTEPFPVVLFVRQNVSSFPDSLVVFTTQDIKLLKDEIDKTAISPDVLFHLLATITNAVQLPNSQAVLVKRTAPPIDTLAVEAFTKLILLSSGKPVHSPHLYAQPPHIVDIDCIRAGTPYHQLNEVFNVMSEYNSRQDLLAKYLSIYHVIENFMFKLPIVELERRRDGEMFSIRDFRRLYQELEVREIAALKKLMGVVFNFEPIVGTRFENIICNRWNAFCVGPELQKMDRLLERLGLRRGDDPLTHATFISNNTHSYFAHIVYAVRNVIVHNTETEWHLSYATLDSTARLLLEDFLLPSLEEICFAFVGCLNPHVWYKNKELKLYQ